jgi:hypothetical protein
MIQPIGHRRSFQNVYFHFGFEPEYSLVSMNFWAEKTGVVVLWADNTSVVYRYVISPPTPPPPPIHTEHT